MDINLFTVAMRAEFLRSMQAVAEPAPFEALATIVPSTARIENYAWMAPAPGISRYVGHRRLAGIDQTKYSVENLEYDGAFSVPLRDIEDDQVGGYKLRMNDLVTKANKPFQARLLFSTLAAGGATTCFDGSNFFGTTHKLGSTGAIPGGFGGGGNALTFTGSGNADGNVYQFDLLVHNGPLRPLMFQNRKPPNFMTDAGTPQSSKQKKADYWIDLEAAAAFGYWWDAINVQITNLPTLIDLFTCIDGARQMMRRFYLPRALPTDPLERVHEQLQFSNKVATIVSDTHLEQLFNHLLYEDRVGVSVAGSTAGITSNIYYNRFGLVVTGYLDLF
jgi:phage major head subunit gpT-like protein